MKTYFAIFLFVSATIVTACGGNATANNAQSSNAPQKVNTSLTPAAVNNEPANAPAEIKTTKPPEEATSNAAPTLGPVFQAYYDGLKKKDAAAVKETMSAGFIASKEKEMKEEGSKDLVSFLTEFDQIPDKIEYRNETISGNKGIAEFRGGAYVNWTKFYFVNEGGKWKLTGGGPATDK